MQGAPRDAEAGEAPPEHSELAEAQPKAKPKPRASRKKAPAAASNVVQSRPPKEGEGEEKGGQRRHSSADGARTRGHEPGGAAEAGPSSSSKGNAPPPQPPKAKFVYNAFEAHKTATAVASIGSDEENVILKLNVSNPPLPVEHPHVSSAAPFDLLAPPAEHPEAREGTEEELPRALSPVPSAYNDNDRHHIHGGSCSSAAEGGRGVVSAHSDGAIDGTPDRMAAPAALRPAPTSRTAHPAAPPPTDEKCSHQLRKIRLLMEFEEKNKSGEWPASTTIHCYWCCHQFDGPPMGIPVKFVREKFYTYGCFCSLECAAAYNFEHYGSVDERWKRFSLLNMLAARLGHEGVVKQAPDRLALTMFGGYLDIEAFRAHSRTRRLVLVNFPPMQTMTQQVEEINDGDVHCTRPSYIPIPSERVDRFQAKLLLQRKNPVVHHKNTLGRTMDLRYWSAPTGGQ